MPLVIANWKMKLKPADSAALLKKVAKASVKYQKVEVVVCPPFTELALAAEIIRATGLKLGAQDCFWEAAGAFTGEISPQHLKDIGAEYVIIGHSERRQYLGETDTVVNNKIKAALAAGLVPVLCVGESFDERAAGQKDVVLIREITNALQGAWFNAPDRLVVAYEPVWVIGSGQAVSPDEAEHAHRVIKQALYDILPDKIVDSQIRIIYGGSVDAENVASFTREPAIEGVLVGGASLDAAGFSALVMAAAKSAAKAKV